MYKKLPSFCLALLLIAPAAFSQAVTKKAVASIPYYADPAISPDGSEIAFSSGGDIWTVPAAGGEAHLLISDPAFDSNPIYSPDGKYLAFNSTRTGNGDIYVPLPGTTATATDTLCPLGCVAVFAAPEPGSLPVLMVGLTGLFGLALRRRVHRQSRRL